MSSANPSEASYVLVSGGEYPLRIIDCVLLEKTAARHAYSTRALVWDDILNPRPETGIDDNGTATPEPGSDGNPADYDIPKEETTPNPTEEPTEIPTAVPTPEPTAEPTATATDEPTAEPTTELKMLTPSPAPSDPKGGDVWHSPIGWIVAAAMFVSCILLLGCLLLQTQRKKVKKKITAVRSPYPSVICKAAMQNIGKRASQQDSYCVFALQDGGMAVVADGMGGLSNGDAVSKKIVQCIESDCERRDARLLHDKLIQVVTHANDEVNRMLGSDGLYKSGSTLVAAVVEKNRFSWISVGDSHIYLYRSGALIQLNREHIFESDLLLMAANHEIDFSEAVAHPKRSGLTSFIGMGKLKHIDRARTPIRTLTGDRLLLCSDGVFNTLSETEIEQILKHYPDVEKAAQQMEAAVLEKDNPHQDNFTAILIGFEA